MKGSYKDGKRDGPWERYYENGQLEKKGSYKDGELDGLYERYYENGQLESRVLTRTGNRTVFGRDTTITVS
jgi:antitoxin component YwqK of YwqJK toxin-antitoxin module